jgi:hypothetical protein
VQQDSDFLRARAVVLLHWSCFVRQIRETDDRNANAGAAH